MNRNRLASAVPELARRLLRLKQQAEGPAVLAEENPPPAGALLHASRPFTNSRQLRGLLLSSTGAVIWLDRHLDLAALDMVSLVANPDSHTSFILIREGRPQERLIREAKRLREELFATNIDFDLRSVAADEWDAHDRWLLSDSAVWCLPPANALNKTGEMRLSTDPDGVRQVVGELLKRSTSALVTIAP